VPLIKSSQGTTKIFLEGVGAPRTSAEPPRKSKDPHEGVSFGVVYANDLALKALASEGRAKFPVGSIIVREKLATADAAQAELVAVMIKRAPGFNLTGGDWEFLTIDGALTKVRERQKKGSCLECHSAQAERDFVFPVPPSK
jgi:hypothetical protein